MKSAMERMRPYVGSLAVFLLLTAGASVHARRQSGSPAADAMSNQQTSDAPQPQNRIRTSATVVLVPALVKTKSGETVFSLTANDFILKDNGAPQTLHLETDTDSQPLALVVIVETGGQGTRHLGDYGNLGAELDVVIRDVPPRYRRAVLLVTETADSGSETSLDEAVRLVSDTNTAIYSFGFSTTKEAVQHEA